MDWTKLSPENRRILRTVGLSIYEGYSESEIAARLGLPPLEVRRLALGLEQAIAAAAGVELPAQPFLATLAELADYSLPPDANRTTWRGRLYRHAERGDIPGAFKRGRAWHVDVEKTLAWLKEAELEP